MRAHGKRLDWRPGPRPHIPPAHVEITGAVVPSALSLSLAVGAVPGWHVERMASESVASWRVWAPESWARGDSVPDVEGPRADVLAWLSEHWAPRAMAWALGEREQRADSKGG